MTCADKAHSTPTKATIWTHGIDHAAAEVGGVVAEQARVLLNALVRVVTVRTGKAQLIHAHGLEPFGQEVAGDPFAQPKLQAFLQKSLCDRERHENADDDQKRPDMMDEIRQVLAAHGVEKLAVPLIQFHLSEHVGDGDGNRDDEDRRHAPPAFRAPQHAREQGQVAGKIEILHGRRSPALVRGRRTGRRARYGRLCDLWSA